jgi:hypothetical protein
MKSNNNNKCKTCGKIVLTDWDGAGSCITCTRDRVLGPTNPSDNSMGLEADIEETKEP